MGEYQVGETISVYAVIFGIHQNHRTGVLEYDIKIRDGDDVERAIYNVPATDITTVF